MMSAAQYSTLLNTDMEVIKPMFELMRCGSHMALSYGELMRCGSYLALLDSHVVL